jgi:hypothetical protein
MTARRDIRMIVPKVMYKVDVRIHANVGTLNRAYRTNPSWTERGAVCGFMEHVSQRHVRIHLGPDWTLNDLVHEAVHAATYLQRDAGQVADDEFAAYLTAWIVERAAVRLERKGKQ